MKREKKINGSRFYLETDCRPINDQWIMVVFPIREPAVLNGHGWYTPKYPILIDGVPLTPEKLAEVHPTEKNKKFLSSGHTRWMEVPDELLNEWKDFPNVPMNIQDHPLTIH